MNLSEQWKQQIIEQDVWFYPKYTEIQKISFIYFKKKYFPENVRWRKQIQEIIQYLFAKGFSVSIREISFSFELGLITSLEYFDLLPSS